MDARGRDLWPASLVGDLVEEEHLGRRVFCYGPDRPRTVVEMLARAVERCPDREAVVDGARRLTWRDLAGEARGLAAGLHARHAIAPGDRVGLLLLNGVEFCVAVFACALLGAVPVTLSTKLRARELQFMLANSGARLLLMDAALWPEIATIRDEVPCEAFYVAGAPTVPPGTAPLATLIARGASPPRVALAEDDTAFLMYTSGTTGRPKGAQGTHLGIINSAISYTRCLGLGEGERSLVVVPLFHVTGLIAQLMTMAYVGGTAVIMRTFDAAEALRLLDAERITHVIGAATVYIMMMNQPGYRARGASVRVFGYGGSPIAPDTVRALRAWLPGARLQNVYGMTETCSPTTILPDADALRRVSSVGPPVPTAEVRTVAPDTGRECVVDEVGELLIRGPMVVAGYWANPEATAAAMGDGWLSTGDLAKIDADGYVTIMDRLKDMINRGGEKVYCVEVEDVLYGHPHVLEAAVVGVPDDVYGESVRACVVPKAGVSLEPADVRGWVAARLAKYKVPREVIVLDALPRNANGKVIKSALRRDVQERAAASGPRAR